MRQGRAVAEAVLVGAPQLSFAQVYDAHVETVYRYVHRRCQDHSLAEDVTQDTFMMAIRNTEDPATITIGWLITVARNRLFDVLRRQTRYQEKLQLLADNTSRSNEVDIAERLRVETALGVLPMHYRLVLTLHYINGMTVRAIADELDQSLKSVEGLVTRARKELIAVLEDAEPQSIGGGES
jgi:RNA polymerase sigma-70 factor (ECF subfamily)